MPGLLSIVIPTFDTAALTLAACRAALAAAPRGSEILVVDDASTDGTARLLPAELPEVRVVRLEANRRFAGAANVGVGRATGDLVMLLNSDALVEPEALDALVAAFDADPRLGVAGARLVDGDGAPQWSGGAIPTLLWMTVLAGGFASILPRRSGSGAIDWVSGAAMMFRREVWNVAGPLDESYRFYAQDLDFCIRARAGGWEVRIVEEARVRHEGGVTMRQWRGLDDALPHDPALLWPDLVTWGQRHHGRVWAMAARRLMIAAATLRIAARGVRGLPVAAHRRALHQLLVEPDQPPRQLDR